MSEARDFVRGTRTRPSLEYWMPIFNEVLEGVVPGLHYKRAGLLFLVMYDVAWHSKNRRTGMMSASPNKSQRGALWLITRLICDAIASTGAGGFQLFAKEEAFLAGFLREDCPPACVPEVTHPLPPKIENGD